MQQARTEKWKHIPILAYFWPFMTLRVAYKMDGYKVVIILPKFPYWPRAKIRQYACCPSLEIARNIYVCITGNARSQSIREMPRQSENTSIFAFPHMKCDSAWNNIWEAPPPSVDLPVWYHFEHDNWINILCCAINGNWAPLRTREDPICAGHSMRIMLNRRPTGGGTIVCPLPPLVLLQYLPKLRKDHSQIFNTLRAMNSKHPLNRKTR